MKGRDVKILSVLQGSPIFITKVIPWQNVFAGCMLLVFFLTGCQSIWVEQKNRGVYHTIQKGHTLFKIAEVYDIDFKTLQRVNNIRDPKSLQIGQRLWIPNALRVLQVPPTGDKTEKKVAKAPETFSKRLKKGRSASIRKTHKAVKGILAWPLKKGILTSRFGIRKGRHHDGIDLAAKTGTVIRAAANGKVVFSGNGPKGYGLMVIIKHPNDLITVYAHNSVNHVGRSMKVKKGQKIALVGSTGRSTGPHLHFEVRIGAKPINPLLYLAKR